MGVKRLCRRSWLKLVEIFIRWRQFQLRGKKTVKLSKYFNMVLIRMYLQTYRICLDWIRIHLKRVIMFGCIVKSGIGQTKMVTSICKRLGLESQKTVTGVKREVVRSREINRLVWLVKN